jgi:tape measure domain-containing protein
VAQSYQVDIVTKVVGASSVSKLEKSLENLTAEQNKVDRASVKAANGIRTFNNSARAAGTASKGATASVQGLGAAINAAAAKITVIVGAVQTFGRVMSATFERENAEKRLKNLTGSAGEYEAALRAATSVSQKFGITQTEATKALGDIYSRLSGVGYGLKEVTTIYQGFNTVARQSGVSSEAASAAFLQLGQAMGSGVLQGDELRSILEQMPQLTQLIANEMGIAAGQVKQFGSEGKITSDVIYKALESASKGAEDLNGKLTPTQQSMNDFNVAVDNASVALGTTLIPAITSLLEAVTPVITAVGLLTEKLNELGLSKVFEFLMAPARAFGDLVNGATEDTVALKQATTDTQLPLDQLLNKYSNLPEPIRRAKAEADLLKKSTQDLNALQRANNESLQSELTAIQQKVQIQQAVLDAEQAINEAKLQSAQYELDAATTQDARAAAAKKIYELTVEQAKLQYESTIATAAAEVQKAEAAAKTAAMLREQIQAEIALQQSKEIFNEAQGRALAAAERMVQMTQAQVETQYQVAEAVGRGADATLQKQIEAARVTMEMQMQTSQQAQTNAQIAEGANQMSRLANEAQRAASASAGIGGGGGLSGGAAMGGTGYTGGGLTSGYNSKRDEHFGIDLLGMDRKFAGSSSSKKYATHNPYSIVDGQSQKMNVQERFEAQQAAQLQMKVDRLNGQSRQNQAFDRSSLSADGRYAHNLTSVWQGGGMIGPKGSQRYRDFELMYGGHLGYGTFAEGGYVSGPTQAVIGEGGEPEYVIPASKLDGAMQRYSAGMRGESMIPSSASVSVNYSGSTVDMGGSSYINKGDVTGIVSQAVNQTLTTLQRSSRARLTAGLR